MNSKISATVVLVTPGLAQHWLIEQTYDGQRTLSTRYIDFLANEMKMGTFRAGTTINVAAINGHRYLINGQHTLSAIIKSGVPIELTEVVNKVNTLEEIAELYSTIDINKYRSVRDAIAAYGLPKLTKLSLTELGYLGSGLGVIETGFKSNTHTKGNRRQLKVDLIEWSAVGRLYFDLISGCPKKIRSGLIRNATISVGLVTLAHTKINPSVYEKCCDFWQGVAMDDGLKRNDPRKVLHELLSETSVGGAGYTRKPSITRAENVLSIAACYNAFMENRPLTKIIIRDFSKPVNLLHTKYDGKQIYTGTELPEGWE